MEKVYIIEDDSIAAFILKKEIERNGSFGEAYTFENGEIALQQLKKDNSNLPDIIFLDINMPIMDGWEFMDELVALKPDFEVPIFMLSSSINPADMSKARDHHKIKGFYSKPITQEMLENIIEILN